MPPLPPRLQWVAKTENGKRVVAGTHWDYDAYGGTLKRVSARCACCACCACCVQQFAAGRFAFLCCLGLGLGVCRHLTLLPRPEASSHLTPAPAPRPLPAFPQALGLPTKMPDWTLDYEAGRKMVEWCGQRVFEAPMHVEGGSIHSDGEGTLVVTEECLLHPRLGGGRGCGAASRLILQ